LVFDGRLEKRKMSLGAAVRPFEAIIDNHRIWERWRWGHDDEKPPIFSRHERHSAPNLLA
jgi:hypothetical protein